MILLSVVELECLILDPYRSPNPTSDFILIQIFFV